MEDNPQLDVYNSVKTVLAERSIPEANVLPEIFKVVSAVLDDRLMFVRPLLLQSRLVRLTNASMPVRSVMPRFATFIKSVKAAASEHSISSLSFVSIKLLATSAALNARSGILIVQAGHETPLVTAPGAIQFDVEPVRQNSEGCPYCCYPLHQLMCFPTYCLFHQIPG